MLIADFRLYFSTSRIARYEIATSGNSLHAINLYRANLKIAKAFHPLIGILEVVLRNRINQILCVHFNDEDWILNQKNKFMIDNSLIYCDKRTGNRFVNDFLKREVEKVEKRFLKHNAKITSGKIVAEQTLGFWTEFFEVHYYKLLFGKPIQIFSYLPSNFGRKEVAVELNKIRLFRNRINHNEPICFDGDVIDFSHTKRVHNSIKNIIGWIDPKLSDFVKELDDVQNEILDAQII